MYKDAYTYTQNSGVPPSYKFNTTRSKSIGEPVQETRVGRKNPKCNECEDKNCIECPDANKVYLIRFTPLT